MCFYSVRILSCVRDFHISHTLVNYNWTVVTQKTNSEHVCFQFGSRGPAKAETDSETSSLSSSPPKASANPALLLLTPLVCRTAGVGFRGWEGVLCGVCGLYMVYYWKPAIKTQSLDNCTYPEIQNYTVYATQKVFLSFSTCNSWTSSVTGF